jgi:hypothetical protein
MSLNGGTSTTEYLKGKAKVSCSTGRTFSFTVSGTATGPYPGIFSVDGTYEITRRGLNAVFGETFTIYSSVTVIGSASGIFNTFFPCPKFGPASFQYSTYGTYGGGYASGTATISIKKRRRFQEILTGL